MLTYNEDAKNAVIEIEVDGKITREDLDRVTPQLEAFVDTHGEIGLVEIVRNLGGMEMSVVREGIALDRRLLPKIRRVAVVGDQGWLGPLARAVGALLPPRLRTFEVAELDAARDWAKGQD